MKNVFNILTYTYTYKTLLDLGVNILLKPEQLKSIDKTHTYIGNS